MKYRRPVTHTESAENTLANPRKLQMAIWFERLKEWRFGILTAVIAGICWFNLFVGNALWEMNDAAGAPQQQGMATVVDRTVVTRKQGPDLTITFKVGDRVSEKKIYDSRAWYLTEPGAKVAVQYRIGKSGKLYIDRWEVPRQRGEQ